MTVPWYRPGSWQMALLWVVGAVVYPLTGLSFAWWQWWFCGMYVGACVYGRQVERARREQRP